MTQEDVVKGLECCTDKGRCGEECPYWGEYGCRTMLEEDALALLLQKEE